MNGFPIDKTVLAVVEAPALVPGMEPLRDEDGKLITVQTEEKAKEVETAVA